MGNSDGMGESGQWHAERLCDEPRIESAALTAQAVGWQRECFSGAGNIIRVSSPLVRRRLLA
jgi:hypothetical protein